jgi:hypothetical protein
MTNTLYLVGFEVFKAVTMKNAVLWGVAPCRSDRLNRSFGGSYRIHLQGKKIQREQVAAELLLPAHAGSSLADFSTLKMEAIRSSETSVQSITSTRRHTPKYGILHFVSCPHFSMLYDENLSGATQSSYYLIAINGSDN